MPLKNFSNIGELQEYEFITGEIVSLDYENDTCEIIIEGDTKTGVPIFYHCNPSAQERSNGAVQGGAFGFTKEDNVVVMRQQKPPNNMFVIGHKSGARPCKPLFIIFSSESGAEAVVWDILNDVLVRDIDSLSNTQTVLSDWGVNTRTECLEQDLRTLTEIWPSYRYGIVFHPDLPTTHLGIDGDIPYIRSWYHTPVLLGVWHNIGDMYGHYEQNFFTNPVSTKDQTPRVGMWLSEDRGVIFESDWDTVNWGVMPPDVAQNRGSKDINGNIVKEIEQEYIFMRGIFDYKFNGTTIFEASMIVSNLLKGAELLFLQTRDGEYFDIKQIDLTIWLASGLSQSAYDTYMYYADNGMSFQDNIYYLTGAWIPSNVMWDKSTGIATHGTTDKTKSTLLFEYASVYPSVYDFFLNNEAWSPLMVAKLKQSLRIYYRHPYFKNNKDAVLFKRVNDERIALSREPLELNWNLYNAAQEHADDIADRKSLLPEHIGSDGSNPVDRCLNNYYGYYAYEPNGQANELVSVAMSENVHAVSAGLKRQLERIVDNTDIQIPKNYESFKTGSVIPLADGDWQVSHDEYGNLQTTEGQGWKQSTNHYSNITNNLLTEAGLATAIDDEGKTYTVQDFGVIGDGNDFTDQLSQQWAGFTTFDSTELLKYVNENFQFLKSNNDERRVPRIFLCTIQ